jgi:ubiquitin C
MDQSNTNQITPMKKVKSKCTLEDCNDRPAAIIGDCRFCQHKFCSKHRLPEVHACNNIQSCREAAFEKNLKKLSAEKCVASKV